MAEHEQQQEGEQATASAEAAAAAATQNEEGVEETPTPPNADAEGKGGGDTDPNTLLSGDEGDGSDGEGKDEDSEGEAKVNAPEKYEYTPPEGAQISEEAQKRIDTFAEDVARKLDLTQEQFQGLMDTIVEQRQSQTNDMADKYTKRVSDWADKARNDKEIGGENLDANVAVAKQALKQFGSKELGSIIDAPSPENPEGLGLGNHPEFLRFMYRVGKAIGDGQMITGEGGSHGETEVDRLKSFYPTMFPNN